jgi:large subunit ribosomal protein L5
MPRMVDKYKNEVVPALMDKFKYKSPMQTPKLVKVVLNMGVGDVKDNPKALESARSELAAISGKAVTVMEGVLLETNLLRHKTQN